MPPTASLPITESVTPATQEELAEYVRGAYGDSVALYPIGGGTSLDYGLPPRQSGHGVILTGLNRVVDFPARDLTVTVEAGITMQALAETLAAEGLRLPVDVPQVAQATLGGVIATATSGPRRFGHGTIRDFVIGIAAVDGRGELFHGGGRVVKNVAGYDFCKLLTGSLGTLGIIAQATLKLRPLPQRTALVAVRLPSIEAAEPMLAALMTSQTTPVAIELLHGAPWQDDAALGTAAPKAQQPALVVGLEGTAAEVGWMIDQLRQEWNAQVAGESVVIEGEACDALWRRLADFPAREAALTLKGGVVPSGVTRLVAAVLAIDPQASIEAHAGNGIVYVHFDALPPQGLSRTLVGQLQPLAASLQGHLVVLRNASGSEATPQSTWGTLGAQLALMTSVKEQFDPRDILNPGRFVYM